MEQMNEWVKDSSELSYLLQYDQQAKFFSEWWSEGRCLGSKGALDSDTEPPVNFHGDSTVIWYLCIIFQG